MAWGSLPSSFWVADGQTASCPARPRQPCFDARPDYVHTFFYNATSRRLRGVPASSSCSSARLAYLKTGKRRWDILAHSPRRVGVLFTGCAADRMLWGRPLGDVLDLGRDPHATFVLSSLHRYLLFLALPPTPTRSGQGGGP